MYALNIRNISLLWIVIFFYYKNSEWKSLHDLLRQNSKSINHFFNFSHLTILKQTSSSNTHIQIEFGAREKNILFFNLLASQLNFSKISVCFSEKGIFFPLLLKSFFYQDRIPKNLKSTSEMHTRPLPTPISTIWKQYSRCTLKRGKNMDTHMYAYVSHQFKQRASFLNVLSCWHHPSVYSRLVQCAYHSESLPFTFFSCYARWTNRKKYISESKSGG